MKKRVVSNLTSGRLSLLKSSISGWIPTAPVQATRTYGVMVRPRTITDLLMVHFFTRRCVSECRQHCRTAELQGRSWISHA